MHIGPFNNPSEVRSLMAYLKRESIQCRLEPRAKQYYLVADDDNQQQVLYQLWLDYRANPQDPKFRVPAWNDDEVLAEPVEAWPSEHRLSRQLVLILKRLSLWQWWVILSCVLVFAVMQWGLLHYVEAGLLYSQYAYGAVEIRQGQWWRLLSPIFLHFSLMHIVFNLLWYWQLSGLIDRFCPRWLNPVLLLVSAVLSNSAEYFWSHSAFGGLSGVVYGLLGFIWWQGRHQASSIKLPSSIMRFMLVWLAIGFSGVLDAIMPMANMAHLGGLVSGILMAQLWLLKNNRN